jgi:hypothetical protein
LTFQRWESLTVAVVRIDVLTVSGCPHRWLAMTRVWEAIHRIGVDAVVAERMIDDAGVAAVVGMAGSPTILLDGRDLFAPTPSEPSISCRLYRTESRVEGAPSVNSLIDALTSRTAAS